MDHQLFECGDFALHGGGILRGARLAYKAVGTLNAARSNAIVYPTSFGTTHADIEWLVGPGKALDPQRYFIIMPSMLGNGLSSSPSHGQPGTFPELSLWDSVRLQHRLVAEHYGIQRLALVLGFSMGGQQAYHWATLFPDRVERLAVMCASARTSARNRVFLGEIRAALTDDPAWNGRFFEARAQRGVRAMAQVYADWALPAEFYRRETFRAIGFQSRQDFVARDWEVFLGRGDPNDLMAMMGVWERADVGGLPAFGGDTSLALRSIRAAALIMPSTTDQYFLASGIEAEARMISGARYCPIETIWGHRVNNPVQNPADARFVDDNLRLLLAV
ncbi:MAG TPA: alpha/beta fold hydrolase [Bordetella sp.]